MENCAHWSVTEVSCTSSSGPQHLAAEFEMLHHRPGLGRGGGQEVVVLGEPRRGAVVIDDAVLAQHQPVARLADGERREGVDVDAVEEGAGIGPCTSILPSVETSQKPTPERTVLTSR